MVKNEYVCIKIMVSYIIIIHCIVTSRLFCYLCVFFAQNSIPLKEYLRGKQSNKALSLGVTAASKFANKI